MRWVNSFAASRMPMDVVFSHVEPRVSLDEARQKNSWTGIVRVFVDPGWSSGRSSPAEEWTQV